MNHTEALKQAREKFAHIADYFRARGHISAAAAVDGAVEGIDAALSLPDPLQTLADTHAALDLTYENTAPSRSKRMAEAGFTQRDTRLTCDECGKKYTPQMLPIHGCQPDVPVPLAEPKLEDEPHVAAYQYLYAGPYGDVWRNDSGLWNGIAPKAHRPLYAERMPLPKVEPSAAPVVPQGWKLVPVEPTREMFAAAGAVDDLAFAHGSSHGADIATLWEVMCDASPPAPQQGEQAGQEGVQG